MLRTSARSVAVALALLAARAVAGDEILGRKVDLPDESGAFFQREGQQLLGALTYHRPLLLLFWRADDAASREKAVPLALQLQAEYPDDLVVVFLERSGLSQHDMLRVACRERWLDTPALWSCAAIPGIEPGTQPAFVLTSPARVAVQSADPVADSAALHAELKWVVEQRLAGAPDLPSAARAAWKALREGRLRDALALQDTATALADRGRPGDTAQVQALSEQAGLIQGTLSTRIELVRNLRLTGYSAVAAPRAAALVQQLGDLPERHPLRQAAAQVLEDARSGGEGDERQASEALVQLQARLFHNGQAAALAQELSRLSTTYPQTHAAGRAAFLATMASPD
jgi:hypothetical protein